MLIGIFGYLNGLLVLVLVVVVVVAAAVYQGCSHVCKKLVKLSDITI